MGSGGAACGVEEAAGGGYAYESLTIGMEPKEKHRQWFVKGSFRAAVLFWDASLGLPV